MNPNSLRIGINKEWESKWYASNKDFAKFLKEDMKIRKIINEQISNSGISKLRLKELLMR